MIETESNQAIWRILTPERDISGVINSAEPMSMTRWIERIEDAVATSKLDDGSYNLEVQIGPLLEQKWTVHVRREAVIVPF